ncbi:small integral membrane protein 8-like [Haliotis cracherodii]
MSKENVPPESDSKVKELFKIRDPGARKLDSTSLFRTVNFELYARPNKFVMFTGLATFLTCVGYMFYMKQADEKNNTYAAMNPDGTLSTRKRTSRWD